MAASSLSIAGAPPVRRVLSRGLSWALAALMAAWSLGPIVWIFISSISVRAELYSVPPHWIPHEPTLAPYRTVLFEGEGFRGAAGQAAAELFRAGLLNSLIISTSTTLLVNGAGAAAGLRVRPHRVPRAAVPCSTSCWRSSRCRAGASSRPLLCRRVFSVPILETIAQPAFLPELFEHLPTALLYQGLITLLAPSCPDFPVSLALSRLPLGDLGYDERKASGHHADVSASSDPFLIVPEQPQAHAHKQDIRALPMSWGHRLIGSGCGQRPRHCPPIDPCIDPRVVLRHTSPWFTRGVPPCRGRPPNSPEAVAPGGSGSIRGEAESLSGRRLARTNIGSAPFRAA